MSALRDPDELAREILRSALAYTADAYTRPGARASAIASAVEGRLAAAMVVAECPDLMRELFALRMAAAGAAGMVHAQEELETWRLGYGWAAKAPSAAQVAS